MPEQPNADELRLAGLAPEATLSDVISVESPSVGEPSVEDLLERLRYRETLLPTALSVGFLAGYEAPTGFQLGEESSVPHRFAAARKVGGNVLIVYEPGSVADLC